MNSSKPITEDQLLGLLKLIAVIGGNPGMLKPVELSRQMQGYPVKVSAASQGSYEENLGQLVYLAKSFGVLK